MAEPIDQPPSSLRINPKEVPAFGPRFRKVGPSIGFAKTFPEEVWDDENFWNNQSVWGS